MDTTYNHYTANGAGGNGSGASNNTHNGADGACKGKARAEKGRQEEADREELHAYCAEHHGLIPQTIARMQLGLVEADEAARLVNIAHRGIKIVYFDSLGEIVPDVFRIRFLPPAPSPNGFAAAGWVFAKYMTQKDTAIRPYFSPCIDWKSVMLSTDPIYVTEGEFSSARACQDGIPCVGIPGAWAFKSKNSGQYDILDDIKQLPLKGREVRIIYDSDIATKPQVMGALHAFARALANLGARPTTTILPTLPGQKKTGIDDFLMARGIEEFKKLKFESFTEAQELWKLNDDFGIILDPLSILDQTTGKLLETRKFTDVRVANRTIVEISGKGEPKIVPAGPKWLRWPMRREFARMAYEPGQPCYLEDGSYNQWRSGGRVFKGDDSAWLAAVDHLFEGKSPAEKMWFLRWCAYPYQHPGEKMFSAVVLFCRTQGAGKSIVGEMLCGAYGGANFSEIGKTTLAGAFNTWAAKKQFILANEIADRKNLKLDPDDLKNHISQDWVWVNEKYQPSYQMRDCCNYYFTSNHRDPLYADDEDRRYFFEHVNEKKLSPDIYRVLRGWNDFPKGKHKNGDGFGPLRYYLQNLDLGDFDPQGPAMITEDRQDVIEAGDTVTDSWCRDLRADPMPFLRCGAEGFVPRDLWRMNELMSVYKFQKGHDVNEKILGKSLVKAGFEKARPRARTAFGEVHLWIIMNPDKWRKASPAELGDHYNGRIPNQRDKY